DASGAKQAIVPSASVIPIATCLSISRLLTGSTCEDGSPGLALHSGATLNTVRTIPDRSARLSCPHAYGATSGTTTREARNRLAAVCRRSDSGHRTDVAGQRVRRRLDQLSARSSGGDRGGVGNCLLVLHFFSDFDQRSHDEAGIPRLGGDAGP